MEHPTDCLCAEVCAPISLPARPSSLNSAPARVPDVELAQAAALFQPLGPYERRVALAHLQALNRLQIPQR